MSEILNLLLENGLTQLQPSTLDKKLTQFAADFEDFCNAKLDGNTCSEILTHLDKLVELFGEVSAEKFAEGVKIGIALTKESQDFAEKHFKLKS